MLLASLRLTNFRNFAEQRLELPPGGVAIVGDNGHGKTNLLEAIYYLAIFRSFRGAPDEQLVRFGETVFRVEGRVASTGSADGGGRSIAAAYDRRRKMKKVTVDGVEPPRIGDALGRLGVIIFSPSDVSLVSGTAALRRRFLDIVLSLTEPRYLEDLQRYRQILQQRNTLLRAGESPQLVEAWNEGLVRTGSRVITARHRWVAQRAAAFARHTVEIAGGGLASIEYEPSVPIVGERRGGLGADGHGGRPAGAPGNGDDGASDSRAAARPAGPGEDSPPGADAEPAPRGRAADASGGGSTAPDPDEERRNPGPSGDLDPAPVEQVAAAFASELHRVAERERRRGLTLVGPHRDDLRLRAASGGGEWVDLRVFGSGGQQRTAAVALRMVEGETLRDRLDSEPVILLDDVFAELDPGRSRRILQWVEMEERAQVILTAPKRADFELRGGTLPLWTIRDGALSSL